VPKQIIVTTRDLLIIPPLDLSLRIRGKSVQSNPRKIRGEEHETNPINTNDDIYRVRRIARIDR